MYEDITCDNNNINKEGWIRVRAECLYTIENTLILLKLVCYKFKILLVIPKVMTKKTTKIYRKGKKGIKVVHYENQLNFLKVSRYRRGK